MALAFIPITLRNNVKPDTLPDPSKEKNRVKQKKKREAIGAYFL